MLEWIILGVLIGFGIAWWFFSRVKFKDKEDAIKARWETKIAQIEKEYELKIKNSEKKYELGLKDAKIEIEKIAKEWNVKYVKDIEELKELFKTAEKKIKQTSVSSSRRSLVGKFIEKFIPFLKKSPYAPADMHFIGQPIDYIVFEGLENNKVNRVTFLEVKTGESKLTSREKSLKETVQGKKVYWKEIRVDTKSGETPDKEMEVEETSIKDLYDKIDNRIAVAKTTNISAFSSKKTDEKEEESEEEEESKDEEEMENAAECPECGDNMVLGDDEIEELEQKGKLKLKCPNCEEIVIIKEEDVMTYSNEEEKDEESEEEEDVKSKKHKGCSGCCGAGLIPVCILFFPFITIFPNKKILLGLIDFHQNISSPQLSKLGVKCCYTPSCSEYGKLAIQKYGAVKGGWMSLARISRCTPHNKRDHEDYP